MGANLSRSAHAANSVLARESSEAKRQSVISIASRSVVLFAAGHMTSSYWMACMMRATVRLDEPKIVLQGAENRRFRFGPVADM